MELLKVDYSGSDTYYSCPLKYYLKHIEGWNSIYGASPLRFGGAFHGGMEGYYFHIQEHGWSRDGEAVKSMLKLAHKEWEERTGDKQFREDHRTFINLTELLLAYIDHFYQDSDFLKVLHTERAFKLLMKPTEIDQILYPKLEPFYFTGKIDMECELNSTNWINEFKTTGWRLDQVVDELNRSPQILGYNYASRFVYKIIPEGNLVTVAYCTSRKSKKTGNYGKLTTDFRRVPQIFNVVDLKKWRQHFISLVAQIQWSIKNNYFPPRFQSCYKYGRCGFLNICEQTTDFSTASFRGYIQEEPWDVTKEVSKTAVMEGEEPDGINFREMGAIPE